jgi:hypothetical protein
MTSPMTPTTPFNQGWGASLRDRASRATHGAVARLRHPATIACAYVLIGIATFGHAAAQTDSLEQAKYEACKRVQKNYCWEDNMSAPAGGVMAAMLWPLYWSWELQS